jgi:hypothetical protein
MYLKRRMQICFLNTVRMIAQLTFNRVVTLDFFWEIMSERRRLDVPEHPRIHHTVRLDLLAVGSGERYAVCQNRLPSGPGGRRTADGRKEPWTSNASKSACDGHPDVGQP